MHLPAVAESMQNRRTMHAVKYAIPFLHCAIPARRQGIQ